MVTSSLNSSIGRAAYCVVVPALTIIGALGSSLGGPAATIIGAIAGLMWGFAAGFISNSLNRRTPRLAGRSLFFGGLVAATLFGGSLFMMMLYVSASTPDAVLALMRPPLKGGFNFFVIFNSLMEWILVPFAVFLNWSHPRRRGLLLTCAILFYLSRAWTYIYFVPEIFAFMKMQAATTLSPEIASNVLRWVNFSWIRCAIDGVAATLFLRAASAPDQRPIA